MMVAAFRPLTAVEPQLTPEQEEMGWALMGLVDATAKSGNRDAELVAICAAMDWQFSVGLLTRERWRELTKPRLLDVIARADELPEGRAMLERIRTDAGELLNSDDYGESAGAALFVVTKDAVQGPRRHAERRARDAAGKADWVDALRSIETRTDLACLLLWTHAYGDAADADNSVPRVEDAREAWRGARAARRKVQGMLESMGHAVDRGEDRLYLKTRKPGGDA